MRIVIVRYKRIEEIRMDLAQTYKGTSSRNESKTCITLVSESHVN